MRVGIIVEPVIVLAAAELRELLRIGRDLSSNAASRNWRRRASSALGGRGGGCGPGLLGDREAGGGEEQGGRAAGKASRGSHPSEKEMAS